MAEWKGWLRLDIADINRFTAFPTVETSSSRSCRAPTSASWARAVPSTPRRRGSSATTTAGFGHRYGAGGTDGPGETGGTSCGLVAVPLTWDRPLEVRWQCHRHGTDGTDGTGGPGGTSGGVVAMPPALGPASGGPVAMLLAWDRPLEVRWQYHRHGASGTDEPDETGGTSCGPVAVPPTWDRPLEIRWQCRRHGTGLWRSSGSVTSMGPAGPMGPVDLVGSVRPPEVR